MRRGVAFIHLSNHHTVGAGRFVRFVRFVRVELLRVDRKRNNHTYYTGNANSHKALEEDAAKLYATCELNVTEQQCG